MNELRIILLMFAGLVAYALYDYTTWSEPHPDLLCGTVLGYQVGVCVPDPEYARANGLPEGFRVCHCLFIDESRR